MTFNAWGILVKLTGTDPLCGEIARRDVPPHRLIIKQKDPHENSSWWGRRFSRARRFSGRKLKSLGRLHLSRQPAIMPSIIFARWLTTDVSTDIIAACVSMLVLGFDLYKLMIRSAVNWFRVTFSNYVSAWGLSCIDFFEWKRRWTELIN